MIKRIIPKKHYITLLVASHSIFELCSPRAKEKNMRFILLFNLP